MAVYTLQQLQAIIAPIAKKHGVQRLWVFGSYGRGEAQPGSDVDLIIEKGKIQTLLQYNAFVNDLQAALQCHVDVITPDIRDKAFLEMIRKDVVKIFDLNGASDYSEDSLCSPGPGSEFSYWKTK